jgi:hypothetical protein
LAHTRDQLDQKLLALAVEFGGEDAEPSRVAAGMGHRAHQPGAEHIVGHSEDRDRRSGLLGGANCRVSVECHDDIDRDFGQLYCNFRVLVDAQSKFPRTERTERQVLTLDEAVPPKLVEKRDILRLSERLDAWKAVKTADAIDSSRLLCAQLERPGESCPAEERDEMAPVDHSISSSARARAARGTLRARALAIWV